MVAKQIFISHISAEAEIAQRLKQHLVRAFRGLLDIFVSSDRATIRAGKKWLDEIEKSLKSADAEVVLCSRESVGRPWINFEAGAAWLRDIPVIPACHSGIAPHELPVPFSMLEGVELSKVDGLQKLYDSIAAVLGAPTPTLDFKALAAEFGDLEKAHQTKTASVQTIDNLRVLCAASDQYSKFDFDLDVGVLQSAFGEQRVTVERALTRKRLSDLLMQRYDIVHLVLLVDSRTGDLIFSSVDPVTLEPSGMMDKLSARSFGGMLVESQTSLVVLATCKALRLAVELARFTNMAGTEVEITGKEAAQWAECFYGYLRQGRTLYQAFDLTREDMREVPVLDVRHHDVRYRLP
jgi:hypothetical protein